MTTDPSAPTGQAAPTGGPATLSTLPIHPHNMHAMGRRFFSNLALVNADPKAWRSSQRTRHEHRRLRLHREQFHRQTAEIVLHAATTARAQAIAADPGDNRPKLNLIGQALIGPLWQPIPDPNAPPEYEI